MKHVRLFALGLGLCACAGLGKLALPQAGGKTAVTASGGSSLEPQAAAKLSQIEAAREIELVYDVDFETKVSAGRGSAQTMVGSMTWTVKPLGAADGKRRFLCNSSAVSVVLDAGEAPQTADFAGLMRQDLERPFVIELDAAGRVVRLGLEREAGMIGLGLEKTLVSGLQFVRPSGTEKSWTTREGDHLGDFTASYRNVEGKGIEKTKSYSKLLVPDGVRVPGQKSTEVKSSAIFVLAGVSTLLPSHVELSEEIAHRNFVSQGKASLSLLEERRRPVQPPPSLDGLRWFSLQDDPSPQENPELELAAKRKMLGGATLPSLLSDLRKLPAKGATLKARHDALAKLKTLFDLDPSAIRDAVSALKRGDEKENAAGILGALSDTSSPAGRDALADLGKDESVEPELRGDAITNLSLQQKPSPKTFDDLNSLAQSDKPEVKNAAVLGLGATARYGAEGDDTKQASERATRDLAAGAANAQTPEAKSLYLDGLGNAGGQGALTAASASLQDPDPSVRATAVGALRFGPAPEADALIAQAWLKDPSADVRAQATFAASFRPSLDLLAQTATQVLATDTDTGVRLSVVQLMGEHLEDQPQFAAALKLAVETDASNDVKLAAARALGSGPTATSN